MRSRWSHTHQRRAAVCKGVLLTAAAGSLLEKVWTRGCWWRPGAALAGRAAARSRRICSGSRRSGADWWVWSCLSVVVTCMA